MKDLATVLVVDDYEDALEATALILERGGFNVAQALNGRQALELVKQLRPDVILLDVMLPDISGLEVLRQIRADPDVADSSVILFSARATDPEQQAGGLDAGADGYLTKPVATAELLARVRAQVRHRELTEALRVSEARYRDLVETSHDLIWAVDAEGTITFLNQACRKIYGREPEEMIGRPFLDFVPAEQARRDSAVFAEALQSGRDTLGYTSRVYAKDGREVTLSANARIIRDAAGRVVGSAGISRDITDQLRSEETARSQTALLRIAGDAARLGGWSLQVPDLILTWSDVTRTIHEVPPGHTPGLQEAIEFYDEADRPAVARAVEQCLQEGIPFDFESVVITAKGRRIWVRAIGEAVRDDRGRIIRLQGAFQDITEQRLAREALQASEERFRLLSKATSDAIWDWDMVTGALWWNEGFETLFGYTRAEVEPTIDSWYNRIHPADKPGVIADVHAAIAADDDAWSGDYRFMRKDGSDIHVHDTGHIIRDQDGKPIRMIGGMTDVTDRKRMERHFLRAQRLESLGTLAGGIAHDLNNALAPVLMSIEILKEDEADPARLATLDILESSVKRSADMVRQVLSFAKGAEGSWSAVNVLTIVRDVEKIAADTFPKNIVFAVKVEAEPWPIRADATQVHQVLINLCLNARDAMPNGGRLSVTVKNVSIDEIYAGMNPEARPGPYVVLRVEDTGMGMRPEVLDRIFEPFYTTKESGRGTGLGLATAHSIVQGHGGFIHVYSEKDRGSTFKVYLPAETTAQAVEGAAIAQTALPRGHGEVILVVDDEQHIRLIAEKTLTRFGYQVRLAGNGAEAVSMYVSHQDEIAAVLTDMAMPVMDGPALIVALKAINPAVLIIGSSGLDANGLVAKAVAAGVQSFVPKPYTAEALLKLLAKLFNRAG